ncbi:hypothetical protein RQM47_02050 [Rubrivirga sp. S365]|uniref:Tellurite resistance protein TerB n=1 Tax=Rubrivirga litoralis TaxID=3075598 RepID=A0ABU3BPA1_9BACT|nr:MULTISPECIES: hypothetical protein [unclassified Rubrivirga]MDT0631070.1 hypothetical protein [Rubrivirga sp. F394]MDT7855418.1 hypothetical protein [Rubrivirga sp. S365]
MGPLDLLTPEPAPPWGGPPPRNAYVELHNLIAAAERPFEFGPSDRDRISERWAVDLASSFPAERLALYQTLLDDALASGDLSGEERALLAHVADTLALTDADLRPAHERAFAVAVEAAVADGALSDEERDLLYTLQHTLGFDPAVAGGAYDVFAQRRLLQVAAHALADGVVSPDEVDEIERIEGALSVEVPRDLADRIAQAAARWEAAAGGNGSPSGLPRRPARPVGGAAVPVRSAPFREAGRWQDVDLRALRTSGGAAFRSALDRGETAGFRVTGDALTGRRAGGRVAVRGGTLTLSWAGQREEVRLSARRPPRRFLNGVLVPVTRRHAVLVDVEGRADALVDALTGGPARPEAPD